MKKNNIVFLYKQTYIHLAIQRDGIVQNNNDPMKLLSRYLQSQSAADVARFSVLFRAFNVLGNEQSSFRRFNNQQPRSGRSFRDVTFGSVPSARVERERNKLNEMYDFFANQPFGYVVKINLEKITEFMSLISNDNLLFSFLFF